LPPPDEQDMSQLRYRESTAHQEHLVGKRGITTTQLTPSGKARFGDRVVNVISEGGVIPSGTDVYVESVVGNEVLVRAVES
jgi:membrane-bound serine protease (ClpP class)